MSQVCKKEVETWDHYEFECEGLKRWLKELGDVYEDYVKEDQDPERWREITRKEWRLDTESKMTGKRRVVIAKGRWRYHREQP